MKNISILNTFVSFTSVLFAGFVFVAHVQAAAPVEPPSIFVPKGDRHQPINSRIEFLQMSDEKITINQVAHGDAGEFKPLLKSNFGFNYHEPILWIRFSADLSNYKDPFWFLTQDYEHVGHLTLYYPTTDHGFIPLELSEALPGDQRLFEIHNYLFKVPTPQASPTTYYMRYVPAGHSLSVDLSWSSTKGVVEYIHYNQMGMGLFFGCLFAMFFYNLVLCIYLRDRSYVYYVYYLASFIATFIYLNGFAPLIVVLSPFWERVFTVCVYAAIHGMVLFGRQFLSLKTTTPKLDVYLRVLQWTLVLGAIGVFFQPPGKGYYYGFIFVDLLIALVMPGLIIAGIRRTIQGYRPARVYLAGWAVFAIATLLLAIRSLGLIGANWITSYSIQLASVWEAIFFALALAYRIKLIEREAATAKSAFLGMISHEVLTPLQKIRSALDLLASRLAGNPQHMEVIARAQGGAEQLERQTSDLRNFSRVEAGAMEIRNETFNASDLMEQIAAEYSVAAEKKGLEFIADIEPGKFDVHSDALRVQQIANNLLSNAIKYTDAGRVALRLQYLYEKQWFMVITVEDTGIGMHKKDIALLFKPFVQVDQGSTRRYDGMGMGLAIVKRLADLLGGTTKVESEFRKGSIFEVRLPIQKGTVSTQTGTEDNAKKSGRILLVDDTLDVCTSLKEILNEQGYACDSATNGPTAVEIASRNRYDAILLDVNMPGMDGFAVAEVMRSQAALNKNAPIIWISATEPQNITSERRKLFSHFLEKPVHSKKLDAMLKEILKKGEPA